MSETRTPTDVEMFHFGEPLPVLDGRDVLDYAEAFFNGHWYEPPVSLSGLSKSFRANAHHSSAIYLKRNILVSTFRPHKLLSAQDFARWALDYLIFGNGYLEAEKNQLGETLRFKPAPAKFMRRAREGDQYLFQPGTFNEHTFREGSIFHLLEPDPNQELYGVPEYLSALNSAWLNESATLFRRKYYENGSHAGYILYMTDAQQENGDVQKIKEQLRNSKGPGNFRNLLVYAPGGSKDGLQLIPISEVTAKDEFFNVKNLTRDDVLAAHRVPPQLMSIVPTNQTGFGPVKDAANVFVRNELMPLQARFAELNVWAGEEIVGFDLYLLGE
ncbi:MAG: phage portal protein [Parvibaculaceae bacterium]|nr:phage portal protein [Parvibaculaceae bacterium]